MIRVRAHAKINLNLRVLDRRPDGYHDLRTVFQAIALHDTLTFAERQGALVLESSDPQMPVDRSNLVSRAADLLWAKLGRDGEARGVAVGVDKRIPMKAGLGGGSADAAAALLGLARLWAPDMPVSHLVALGAQLGADVPFFFTGGAALGMARGDQISPLADLPPLCVLLVVPSFDVATADAYRWVDESREGPTQGRASSAATNTHTVPNCPWPSPANEIANDFEAVVSARHPEIAAIVGRLHASGALGAAMTGSGSAVFGLFVQDRAAVAAEKALGAAGYRTLRTRTLSRQEYLQSSAPQAVTSASNA